MSYQAFFEQTEAVARVLDEYIHRQGPEDTYKRPNEEEFTAVWQAVELLSRAYSVLVPMVQFEASRVALNLPDVKEKAAPKPVLYGPDGQAL